MSSLQWNFYQVLGHPPFAGELHNDETITAIQFEKLGNCLAIGDQGGRVVIFERDDRNIEVPFYRRRFLEELDSAPAKRPKFRFKSEFLSHNDEIDLLFSEVISERINKVSWHVAEKGSLSLLSANKRKIKLWSVREREIKEAVPHGPHRFLGSENVLLSYASNECQVGWTENLSQKNPHVQENNVDDEVTAFNAKCRKVYAPDAGMNINSISCNSDGLTFISADEYRIKLWNLEVADDSYNIVDMKQSNTDNPFEMISSAEFHPVQCHLQAYGSTDGVIRISDLRKAAICDYSARVFHDRLDLGMEFPFEETAAYISDVKFLADDGIGAQQFISRDYMNIKLWDMRINSRPVETFIVHEHLRPRLADLYYKNYISDQFDCCYRRDGLCFATGSYSNQLKIFAKGNTSVEVIKLDVIGHTDSHRMPFLPKGTVRRKSMMSNTKLELDQGGRDDDLDSKLLRVAWHPTSNLVASAVKSMLILYHV